MVIIRNLNADDVGDGNGVRVAILDDHRLMSSSVSAALRAEGFEVVVPELVEPAAVESRLRQEPPAVALLDLDLGAFGRGEDLLPILVALETRVLIVSGITEEPVIGRCLQAGAWGWVPKSAPLEELLEAVRSAASGRPVLDPAERDHLLRAWREWRTGSEEALAPFARLSRREAQVLAMLRDGKSVERIAAESFVAEATVRTQVRAILTKLEVNSQLEAVAKAARAGWVPDR
ncbi:MAG TPA: response regulator transcription factor [Acidimicrobiales bacterium]|nr:response regulator transcription factor [Acidimicrobiales bacterium]